MLSAKVKSFFCGEFLILTASFFWGLISFFTRPLNNYGFSSIEIAFIRSFLAVIFLGVIFIFKGKEVFKISLKDIPLLFITGVGGFMALSLLYTVSIAENGSSVAAMLEYSAPVWAIIISRFVFKERITLIKILSLAGVIGGTLLITLGGEVFLSFKGVLIGLLTGLVFAIYGVLSKLAGKNNKPETVTFYIFLFSALGSFFISAGWNVPVKIAENIDSLYYFIGLSFLSTALAYFLYTVGLKTVQPGKASMLCTVELVVATVVGYLVFNDEIGLLGYLGIAVTILSLILLETGDMKFDKNKKALDKS